MNRSCVLLQQVMDLNMMSAEAIMAAARATAAHDPFAAKLPEAPGVRRSRQAFITGLLRCAPQPHGGNRAAWPQRLCPPAVSWLAWPAWRHSSGYVSPSMQRVPLQGKRRW
jgi:hypothetical protein